MGLLNFVCSFWPTLYTWPRSSYLQVESCQSWSYSQMTYEAVVMRYLGSSTIDCRFPAGTVPACWHTRLASSETTCVHAWNGLRFVSTRCAATSRTSCANVYADQCLWNWGVRPSIRLSVCPSAPSVPSCARGVRRVSCWAPCRQQISTTATAARRLAAANASSVTFTADVGTRTQTCSTSCITAASCYGGGVFTHDVRLNPARRRTRCEGTLLHALSCWHKVNGQGEIMTRIGDKCTFWAIVGA